MNNKRIKWSLEKRKLQDLKPHPNNPRVFTEKGMKDLENSINSIGFMQPININQDGTILSGHARVMKLQQMGDIEADVYVPDRVLTPKQEEEVLIRANANTAGEWDFDMLGNEFEFGELEEWGLDIPDMEFDDEVEETIGDDEEPKDVPLVTELGDLYELGEHRLICGDCTIIDNLHKLMQGKKADMVFTDPPYNTGMKEKSVTKSTNRLAHMFNDSFTDEEWEKLLKDFNNYYYLFTKDNSVTYICLDWRRSHELVIKAKEAGFKFSNLIVWDKVVHGLGGDYQYTHEFIHVFKKGKPEINSHQGEQEYQDVWHIQRKTRKDEDHATKKPIELVQRAIRHASKSGDLILDFFQGSGLTLIACEKTNRKCYGMELEPKYCDVVVKRYIDFCNKNNKEISVKRNGEDCLELFLNS